MSAHLSDEKNELVRNVAEKRGFQDFKVEVKAGSMKGDGYLGIINTVKIEDGDKKLDLIMKSAMSGDKLRESAPVRKAYEREIYLYEKIFPELERFSEENGIRNRFSETARCYGSIFADKEECILLENLKEKDFRLWNRKKPMDENHIELVFKTYAKLHGTSLAFRILNPEKFEEFRKNLVNIFEKENQTEEDAAKFEESGRQIFGNGFRAIAGNEEATRAFTNFATHCTAFFKEDIKQIDKFSCILHGDCWCNNMMFKYDDSENPQIPTEMCLLDWQISQVGSPILDLSYFFYACGSKEVFYKLKRFLKVYHDSFSKTVKEAGLDPEEVCTYEELEMQWKKFSKFGLFMALFVMKIILSEVEEAPDLNELANAGKDILESIQSTDSVNSEIVNKRIADIIIFMTDNNYL